MTERHRRPIRSFVRRDGRLTESQQAAIDQHWSDYAWPEGNSAVDAAAVFDRAAPLTVEIGFGAGEALLHAARHEPERNLLGIEVYRAGLGQVLRSLAAEEHVHVRVCDRDAVEVLRSDIADATIATVRLFFPDPWPKKRHHKRRIVNPAFADLLARKVQPGGHWHLATDWTPYAQWMWQILDAHPAWTNLDGPGGHRERPASRPLTRFERRGQRRGHEVFDLVYVRT